MSIAAPWTLDPNAAPWTPSSPPPTAGKTTNISFADQAESRTIPTDRREMESRRRLHRKTQASGRATVARWKAIPDGKLEAALRRHHEGLAPAAGLVLHHPRLLRPPPRPRTAAGGVHSLGLLARLALQADDSRRPIGRRIRDAVGPSEPLSDDLAIRQLELDQRASAGRIANLADPDCPSQYDVSTSHKDEVVFTKEFMDAHPEHIFLIPGIAQDRSTRFSVGGAEEISLGALPWDRKTSFDTVLHAHLRALANTVEFPVVTEAGRSLADLPP